MSDDTREREPLRDLADNPPEAGTRSDIGVSGDADDPPGQPTDSGAAAGPSDARDPLSDVQHPTADE